MTRSSPAAPPPSAPSDADPTADLEGATAPYTSSPYTSSRDEVVRVPAGGLTIAARESVTVASEADTLVLTAATEIVLNVGQSTLTLRADGTILLNGRRMTLNAPAMIDINPDPVQAPTQGARPCGCGRPTVDADAAVQPESAS